RLLLKVHRSNFQVTGFTADVPPQEVAAIARGAGVASLFDLGSGLLLDLSPWGLAGEPTVAEALASGVAAVAFSGDKLLGGPQAGILLGAKAAIEACRTDPLARAVRSDKFTLAALEATLALYRDPGAARQEIPVLRMLTENVAEIRQRGAAPVSRGGPRGGRSGARRRDRGRPPSRSCARAVQGPAAPRCRGRRPAPQRWGLARGRGDQSVGHRRRSGRRGGLQRGAAPAE